MATVRCEILDASMLPPTTATEVQIVCPIVAPTATPIAFLCVASCRTRSHCPENNKKYCNFKIKLQANTRGFFEYEKKTNTSCSTRTQSTLKIKNTQNKTFPLVHITDSLSKYQTKEVSTSVQNLHMSKYNSDNC